MQRGNTIIILVILAALIVGGIVYFTDRSAAPARPEVVSEEFGGPAPITPTPVAPTRTEAPASIREVAIEAKDFSFTPAEVRVRANERVKLTLTNAGTMPHDWVLEGYPDAKTVQVAPGQTQTIFFTPTTVGTSTFYCSVGNHRARGMTGRLIVE